MKDSKSSKKGQKDHSENSSDSDGSDSGEKWGELLVLNPGEEGNSHRVTTTTLRYKWLEILWDSHI